MSDRPIVILGAGHSGTKAAAALRKHGWSGQISLIGEEGMLPYDRPPLSKAVLSRAKNADECALFPTTWFVDTRIDLHLNATAACIHRDDASVELRDGRCFGYSRLLLATGSALRPLSIAGSSLGNVWPLRNPAHARAVAEILRDGLRLIVIGAGAIGLEVAAAASKRGCNVKVLETGTTAMGRSLPPAASTALIEVHQKHGIDIRLGTQVAALEGTGCVSGVRLESGEVLDCDAVVYGIGVTPRDELASAAGLETNDGIVSDQFLETSAPNIFACGDVCRYESRLFGARLRMENWRNAEDQADTVARNLLGQRQAYDMVPWFWSNQFDIALQVAGFPALGHRTEVKEVNKSRVFLSYRESGQLIGATGIGAMRDIAAPIRKIRDEISATAP